MKKQISGGMVLSLISQAISITVGLTYTPIMIRILGQSEYGLYQLVQSVVNYLNLMNFGFSGAYIRYFSMARGKGDRDGIANINGMFMKVFLCIGFLVLIGGMILLANIHILGTQITEAEYVIARKLLIIMVISLSLSFPNSLFTIFMAANEDFIFNRIVNIVTNIILPLITLPLLFLGYGSVGVVAASLGMSVLRFIINAVYCKKKLQMKINLGFTDMKLFKGLVGYTFFIFLSDIVDQLNLNVDKFLLGRMVGTVSVAIYGVGFLLKQHYTGISWLIPEMYIPEANRLAIEEKDDWKLTLIFTKMGKINNYICLLVITGFILIGQEFISLWVGEGYEKSFYVALILMVAGYIPAVQTLGVNIQNAKNMHRMRSIVYFGIACVNVVCSIFLIRLWGEIGTSLGTLIAVLIGSGIFMNIYYHKVIKLDVIYFWKQILGWTVTAGALMAVVWAIKRQIVINTWPTLILFILIYTGLYLSVLWFAWMKKSEKAAIKQAARQLLRRSEKTDGAEQNEG